MKTSELVPVVKVSNQRKANHLGYAERRLWEYHIEGFCRKRKGLRNNSKTSALGQSQFLQKT